MIALVIKYGCVVLCLWTESVCHAQHGWSLSAPHDIWTGQPTRIPPFLNPFLIPAIVHGVSGVPVWVGAADASDVEAKLLMFSYYPESLMDSEAAAAGSQLEWVLCYQCRTNVSWSLTELSSDLLTVRMMLQCPLLWSSLLTREMFFTMLTTANCTKLKGYWCIFKRECCLSQLSSIRPSIQERIKFDENFPRVFLID